MLVLKLLAKQYNRILESKGGQIQIFHKNCFIIKRSIFVSLISDKRFAYLPFQSPIHIAIVVIIYLYFVLKVGPKFMEKRRPYKIDRILLLYNFLQVLFNVGIVGYVSIFQIHPRELCKHVGRKKNGVISVLKIL